MVRIRSRILLALVTSALLATSVNALPNRDAGQQTTGEPSISEKGFRSRVFEIKHRSPRDLVNVLNPLLSGFKGAVMTYNEQFRTITIRDFPENIGTVEEALKRLDVPEPPAPPRPGVEFRVHILIASNTGAAANQYPPDLADVVKQLQTTLNYKNYYLMTSQVLRYEGASRTLSNKGIAEFRLNADTAASKNPIFYNYTLQDPKIREEANSTKVDVGSFNFSMKVPLMVRADQLQYEDIGFQTPVTLGEANKVVVGTTSLEDKGIIVVLSAKIMK